MMFKFIDNLYNNYNNVTKMTLFNYIKTGNTVLDALLSTFFMSFFGLLINYLYDNYNKSYTLFNILFIYDIFYTKNCMILEGTKSSTNCRYTNTHYVSFTYSKRFKALWSYIIKNIHQTNTIYQIKESYSTLNPEINKKQEEAIFMVCQNKTFSIDKNIFITSNIIEEDTRNDKDTNNTKTDKIIIYIYSYIYPLDYIIKYIDNITDIYLTNLKNSRNNKLFIYQLTTVKYDDKIERLQCWSEYNFESARTFQNLFFEGKQSLIEKIDFFVNNRKWYYDKGIPYTLGIGLYGPPGTGKTSFVKALANYIKRHLIIISLKLFKTKRQLDDFYFECTYNDKNESNSISFQNKIVLFEDIDCIGDIVLNRNLKTYNTKLRKNNQNTSIDNNNNNNNININNINKVLQNMCELKEDGPKNILLAPEDNPITLDDILNLWDGIRETPGRILIISSNHYDKLDPALIRPGRIDITHELNNASHNTISDIHLHLFGTTIDKQKLKKIKPFFYSPAELINIYISYKNEKDFLNRLLQNKKII